MQQHNPYEPPRARLQEASSAVPIPRNVEDLNYAGFWQRFGAYWIDVVVVLPVGVITYFLSNTTRFFYLYQFIPSLLIQLFFHVYLVKRYGGTPGKLVLNTRIALVDGSPITAKAAWLRFAVLFVLSAICSAGLCTSVLSMTDETYFSLGFFARSEKLEELAPSWYYPVSLLAMSWVWSEFISMMFNKKRRALHDFIAGTVVVRSRR